MSGTIIITKNSTTTSNPGAGSLVQGEQAYSFTSQKLFIGDPSSPVNDIIIGGKHFTDKLDHTHGVLTAESAIIVDAASKIDIIHIDNITINGNTITTSNANGDLILDPNGSGNFVVQGDTDIVGNLTVSGTQTFTGQATFASVNVTDLTEDRVLLAGALGELEDSGNLTFNGTLLTVDGNTTTTGNALVNGTFHVDGQSTLASLNVEDLISGRVTFAGASGELKDSNAFRFDGTTLYVDGAIDVDNIKLDGNGITATDTNGSLVLTPLGTGTVKVNTSTALLVATGLESTRPTAASLGNGAIRYNQTSNRFEGTVSGSWTGLGGVVDVDQDTYIVAEEGADDDHLRFYAAGTQEAYINASGMWITDQLTVPTANITTSNVTQANIVTADITGNLEVDGTAVFNNGASITAGDLGIADNLNVSGNAIIDGNLTVNGTTTAVNSTVTTLNDPVIKLGDGSLPALDLIDRGINFDYGDGAAVQTGFFGFDNASNRFVYKLTALAADEADQDYSAPWGDAQFGNLFIDNNASIVGTIAVTGAATLSNTLAVTGVTTLSSNATVGGTFGVTGNTTLTGTATLSSTLAVAGTTTLTGAATLQNTLGVTGATTLSSTLAVTGASTLSNTLNVVGATDLDSTLNVDGNTTLNGTITLGVGSGAMLVSAAGVMTHGTIDGGTF
jgi:hypothetical protein